MTYHHRTLAATLSSLVLALMVLGVPAGVLAVTQPVAGAVAKAVDFVIVPPWAAGSAHTVECAYGCGLHQHAASTIAPNDAYALDFDLDRDQAVHPVADGTVVYAGPGLPGATTGWTDYGDLVYVEHDDGYSSLYAHLGSIEAEAGDEVTTATPLGTAGESGTEGGVHLHFALYQGAVTDARGMWYGGASVVPEPFSQCSGDCEDLVVGSELTRTTGTTAAEPTSDKPPVARPEELSGRVPWAAGEAHEPIGSYDPGSSDGFGLTFAGEPGDVVLPLYGGAVVYAGCATGQNASLGRIVVVRDAVGGHTYDTVYGHLDPTDPVPSGPVATDDVIGHFGSSFTSGTDCSGTDGGPTRLYVGLLRDADVLTAGELSGGRVVYPEPLVGRGAYEGFTWWTGPATAIDLDTDRGKPTGRWTKQSAKDGQDIAFGDPVTLVAKVRDNAPIREVRFTAYYPDWPRPNSMARLAGFDPKRTWRILAVCRPPKVGGEPSTTDGCRWDGSATNATVSYTWDPTAQEKQKPAPWQPIPRTAMTVDSKDCLPVSLSFDIYDSAGYRAQGPAGAKIVQRCRKPTDKPGLVVNLQPLQPPKAPGNVRVACKYPDKLPDGYQMCASFQKVTLRWEDRSDEEDSFEVFARLQGVEEIGDICREGRFEPRKTGWVPVATLPADTEAWRFDPFGVQEAVGQPKWSVGQIDLRVAASNRAGPSQQIGRTGVYHDGYLDFACPP